MSRIDKDEYIAQRGQLKQAVLVQCPETVSPSSASAPPLLVTTYACHAHAAEPLNRDHGPQRSLEESPPTDERRTCDKILILDQGQGVCMTTSDKILILEDLGQGECNERSSYTGTHDKGEGRGGGAIENLKYMYNP